MIVIRTDSKQTVTSYKEDFGLGPGRRLVAYPTVVSTFRTKQDLFTVYEQKNGRMADILRLAMMTSLSIVVICLEQDVPLKDYGPGINNALYLILGD